MNRRKRQIAAGVLALSLAASTYMVVAPMVVAPAAHAEAPAGQITWALHFPLAPTLSEPAETLGLITPFLVLSALHDSMLPPTLRKARAPRLAKLPFMAPVGLTHE